MPHPTTAAYPETENLSNENSVNVSSVCTLCDGSGWELVRTLGGEIAARKCKCRQPQQKVAPKVKSWKMAAAGDVA